MKIIVEKIYYEEDVYEFPSRNWAIKVKQDEVSKAVLAHKKGDLKEKRIEVKKYCCDKMKEEQDNTVTVCEEYVDYNFRQTVPGCFLLVPTDDEPGYLSINYCPFCGQKIEIIRQIELKD